MRNAGRVRPAVVRLLPVHVHQATPLSPPTPTTSSHAPWQAPPCSPPTSSPSPPSTPCSWPGRAPSAARTSPSSSTTSPLSAFPSAAPRSAMRCGAVQRVVARRRVARPLRAVRARAGHRQHHHHPRRRAVPAGPLPSSAFSLNASSTEVRLPPPSPLTPASLSFSYLPQLQTAAAGSRAEQRRRLIRRWRVAHGHRCHKSWRCWWCRRRRPTSRASCWR